MHPYGTICHFCFLKIRGNFFWIFSARSQAFSEMGESTVLFRGVFLKAKSRHYENLRGQNDPSGTYFHRIIKADVEVVAGYKSYSGRAISILTHFSKIFAPTRCCTHQAHNFRQTQKKPHFQRFFSSACTCVQALEKHPQKITSAPQNLIPFDRTHFRPHTTSQSGDMSKKPMGQTGIPPPGKENDLIL